MHELSLADGILRILVDSSQREGFSRVGVVRLEVGRLAAVDLEALRTCFEVVTQGTVAEGARLEVCQVEGRGECLDCGRPVAVATYAAPCPECGGPVRITSGTGLRVKELDVE